MAAKLRLRTLTTADGLFENMPTALAASTAAEVELDIEGLDITIECANPIWSTNDPMEYTITITNTTTLPFTAPITIQTDAYPQSVCLVDHTTTTLNGSTTGFTASAEDGILTVVLDEDIEGGGTAALTFQINKVTTP